ncbi:unnamed protein product [Ectocarpus sp. 12 AP-2014]
MSGPYVKDLSRYPTSISGDQVVQNIIQVAQSDGVDPVSLDHEFYGVSEQGRVFSMASFRVVETGPNTSQGSLELHVYNSEGVSVPVLTIGDDGMTVCGSFSVKGGHTSFETTSVVTEDKDVVLASNATAVEDLHQGGLILGTENSGTKTLLYDSVDDTWISNVGVNATRLTVGDIELTPGNLKLSSDVSLESGGLKVGDVSVAAGGSVVVNSGDGNSVVLDKDGVTLGSDVMLDHGGLHLHDTEAALYIGENAWKIAYDSSSQHLAFEFYDPTSHSYVTKAEIKS